jgi:hypothetical protein
VRFFGVSLRRSIVVSLRRSFWEDARNGTPAILLVTQQEPSEFCDAERPAEY